MNNAILAKAANEARGLAMDAVHKCSSGHLGLPLGAAEVGAVLFGESLQCDPADSRWLNRDRFVLSAGHGSMFIYSWLHLSGYNLSLEEVKNFRVLHSLTPGHPEFHETEGVESTTGPLGQGVGNAVGYALSGKMAAAKYNTAEHTIIDNHVIALAGVGEDGPTHQPVETVSGLRVIPNLDVIRPADAEETAAAFAAAFSRADGPTLLSLSRQDLPLLGFASAATRREGTLKGGYILVKESAPLTAIVLSTGSEVQWAVEAAKGNPGVRVVSLPCFERFDRQPQSYRDEVLPAACTKRIAIEAGVSGLWWKYVGTQGTVLGIDRFGISAPGNTVMKELGMTAEAVKAALG